MSPTDDRPAEVSLRGAGGAVFTYEVDRLNDPLLKQLARGALRPADAASAKRLAAAGIQASER